MISDDCRPEPSEPRRATLRAGWIMLAFALLAQGVGAATFPDLYSIIVPLNDGTQPQTRVRTQEETIRLAMGQLLTRVTGRRDAAFEPALGGMLQNARSFVEQIGSLDRDNQIVRFNAGVVESALIGLEQPVWGPERPVTLVWLAVDAGLGRRELLSADASQIAVDDELAAVLDAMRTDIATAATERGLLLALPLLDIEDMTALGFVDVWGGFQDRIERASVRYGADDILVGQVRLTDFGPSARWTLIRGGREIGLPGQTVREGLDALADVYAAEFSTLGRASATSISIVDVRTLDDYGRVMRYMESLSTLEAVMPEEFTDGVLRLRVAARGGEPALRRVLALGESLVPVPGAATLTFALRR